MQGLNLELVKSDMYSVSNCLSSKRVVLPVGPKAKFRRHRPRTNLSHTLAYFNEYFVLKSLFNFFVSLSCCK